MIKTALGRAAAPDQFEYFAAVGDILMPEFAVPDRFGFPDQAPLT